MVQDAYVEEVVNTGAVTLMLRGVQVDPAALARTREESETSRKEDTARDGIIFCVFPGADGIYESKTPLSDCHPW